MSSRYEELKARLVSERHRWLVTGAAGFIGSSLVEQLLRLNQEVVGLDNFMTGRRSNLENVRERVGAERWAGFSLQEGDIRDLAQCRTACEGAEFVLHQAALGSVPRSLENPLLTHDVNINGFLNLLVAARDAKVSRFVYAASSSTYGDSPSLPKQEDVIGKPLSPYAVTKYVNEVYADVFARCYQASTIGLRYFNVFGRRQDPNGAYAAVIPLWFASVLKSKEVFINGDGDTSRDFCHVDNAVQANLLAAVADDRAANKVYNVAFGERTTLTQLFQLVRENVQSLRSGPATESPTYREFRPGDVRHSLADISRARELLGYEPAVDVRRGLQEAAAWYLSEIG